MIVGPILLLFSAYSVSSYGVILLRGWNITARQWINPLAGFTWPADGSPPLCIPPGQLWPSSTGGVACSGASAKTASVNPVQQVQQTEAAAAKAAGRVYPGQVAGRY